MNRSEPKLNEDGDLSFHEVLQWLSCAQAVATCRKEAHDHPDEDPPKLALALALLYFARNRGQLGQREQELDALNEAVELLRQLMTRSRDDTILCRTAEAVFKRGFCLMLLGRRDEALADTIEAIRLEKEVWRAGYPLMAVLGLFVLWLRKRKLLNEGR